MNLHTLSLSDYEEVYFSFFEAQNLFAGASHKNRLTLSRKPSSTARHYSLVVQLRMNPNADQKGICPGYNDNGWCAAECQIDPGWPVLS